MFRKYLFSLYIFSICIVPARAQEGFDFEIFFQAQNVGLAGQKASELNYWIEEDYDKSQDLDLDFTTKPIVRGAFGCIFNYFPGDNFGFLLGIQYSGHGQSYFSRMTNPAGNEELVTRKFDYVKLPVGLTAGFGDKVRFDADFYMYPAYMIGTSETNSFTKQNKIATDRRHKEWAFGSGIKTSVIIYVSDDIGISLGANAEFDFTNVENKSASFTVHRGRDSYLVPVYYEDKSPQRNFALGIRYGIHYRISR